MSKRKMMSQVGFSHLLLIAAILLIAIVGFIGYRVFAKHNNTQNNTTADKHVPYTRPTPTSPSDYVDGVVTVTFNPESSFEKATSILNGIGLKWPSTLPSLYLFQPFAFVSTTAVQSNPKAVDLANEVKQNSKVSDTFYVNSTSISIRFIRDVTRSEARATLKTYGIQVNQFNTGADPGVNELFDERTVTLTVPVHEEDKYVTILKTYPEVSTASRVEVSHFTE